MAKSGGGGTIGQCQSYVISYQHTWIYILLAWKNFNLVTYQIVVIRLCCED